MRDEEMLAEIEDFIEGNQTTYRGMRINGQQVATWSSQHGWSRGIAGPMPSGYSEPPVVPYLAAFAFATERRFACGF
jgi:hypothetical protein